MIGINNGIVSALFPQEKAFHVTLQLAVKALDSAESLRRRASDSRDQGKTADQIGSTSRHGITLTEVKNQFDADERYGTEVVSLVIPIIATCVFYDTKRGVSEDSSSTSALPSTVALEAYMKKLRLDRLSKCEGLNIDKDVEFLRRPEDFSHDLSGIGWSKPCSLIEHGLSFDTDCKADLRSFSFLDGEECPPRLMSISMDSDTTQNNSRDSLTALVRRERECAEALSPSISCHTSSSSSTPKSTGRRKTPEIPNIPKDLTGFMSEIEALGNSYIGRETLGKSAYPGRIILQPKPAVLSTRSVSTPINLHDKRTQHLEVEEKQKRVESVSEDLADVLLRICLQLDAIMERRANFYGGIFHMPPLFSELKMLKARVSLCLDYLSSGCRHSKPFKRSSVISGGRNAPILDDDSIKEDFSAMQVLHDPFFQLTPTIKDVVGRVFWQDMSSRGQSHGTFKYVTWKQFADAFERVYGQQPRSVMDRFQTALMQMEEDISALDLDEIDNCNESYEKSGEDMISTTRSGDYFTLNGLRKFCMYGNNNNSNSPSRKKRKSHVPKWIRKSIPCQIGDGQLDEDVCECCPKNTPQMEVEMEACFREYTNYSCNIRPSSFVVSMNIFSKFCTDFGGLFEGFIKVTDPGTHIECLGSVEDLSKEELYNLGMVEDSDVGDSSSNEVPENSVLLKPTIIKDLLGLKILQLSCGGQHAAVLLEGGEVFTVSSISLEYLTCLLFCWTNIIQY